jgi:hypothetical protein
MKDLLIRNHTLGMGNTYYPNLFEHDPLTHITTPHVVASLSTATRHRLPLCLLCRDEGLIRRTREGGVNGSR